MSLVPDFSIELAHVARAVRGAELWAARLGGRSARTSLLEHAMETVPRYRDVDLPRSLARPDFVTCERADLAEDPDEFRSSAFDEDELTWASTSGTTGVALRIPRDDASQWMLTQGTFIVFFERIPELRAAAVAGQMAVLQINDNPTRSDAVAIAPVLGYARMRQSVLGRSSECDARVLDTALHERPALLSGRPRALLAFADLLDDRPGHAADPFVAAVVCSGDNLYPDARARLEATFHAPVYNVYASREAGLVAMECSEHCGLHAVASLAEIRVVVDGQDASRSAGSGELVVSSFQNWAMPLLGYRTADQVELSTVPCRCGESTARIVSLHGRDSTYFDCGGQRVNPSVFNEVFENLPIRQFQLRQRGDGSLAFRWTGDDGEEILARVESEVRAALARVAVLDVQVERVESLTASDKKMQRYVRDSG